MDNQAPGQRARDLNSYFRRRFRFQPEKYIGGTIVYKRRKRNGTVERIIVKHELTPEGDEGHERERKTLLRLWGAEHIVKLLSFQLLPSNKGKAWRRPDNRDNAGQLLAWKLSIDPHRYPGILGNPFFVVEYLARGTVSELIGRCRAHNIRTISQSLLWSFFLCLTRACAGMLHPQNIRGRTPAQNWRETLPGQGSESKVIHGDLHTKNAMFGDSNANNPADLDCHVTLRAQRENIRRVGELMHQMALLRVEADLYLISDLQRASFVFDDGRETFRTWAKPAILNRHTLSPGFRALVCKCMAVDIRKRPKLHEVLRRCEDEVAAIDNWGPHFANELSALFDEP
ncbi:hypothetical protein GGR50DRAFT_691601 [Xylaria sp. CBS 124048]|nr:hypothetical protein GGR50DRAFT_691601 [Xylaria sp. CBS 124048]